MVRGYDALEMLLWHWSNHLLSSVTTEKGFAEASALVLLPHKQVNMMNLSDWGDWQTVKIDRKEGDFRP